MSAARASLIDTEVAVRSFQVCNLPQPNSNSNSASALGFKHTDMSNNQGPSQLPAGKTKAKKRYLKRKKEKRKFRSKVAHAGISSVYIPEEDVQEEIGTPEATASEINENAAILDPPETSKRSKKRPRLVQDEDVNMNEPPVEDKRRTATPELIGVLPSFPLPALPNAPSKNQLSLQGVDKALIDAELVSPSTILPVLLGKDDGGTRLSERMRKRLRDIGVIELFAVQTTLLPFLLPPQESSRELYLPFGPPRDVCVSAPTGSGKTLAYVLPILEILARRVVTRLRALIVLPTRDLVAQVRETIEVLSKGTNLKIGTATGQHSFAHEQSQLVQDQTSPLQGGSSKVDILIATPGRLIDHIVGTPGFSLQHLRFLVIDEADRLLAQSFQDWLAQVLAATRVPANGAFPFVGLSRSRDAGAAIHKPASFDDIVPDGLSPTFLQGFHSAVSSFFLERKTPSCQKLLFSATLTRDPAKIASLELRNPKYIVVQGRGKDSEEGGILDVVTERFSMPATLSEHMVIMEPNLKPLVFFHLVHTRGITSALVFTKSAESTTRLVRLFEFFETVRCENLSVTPFAMRAYSSDLPANERKMILEQFKSQRIQILVCSDLISRGLDISHVSHVVSYDVPVDMRKYVHRVGRTARAGRTGDAWTLVEEQEARYFKQMLKEADHLDQVKRLRISEKDLAPLTGHYEVALNKLKQVYTRQA
ncbi:unnamed protein product [Cyclocybe aegerita]|uniref:ATP-dependent RNA helicase n=1 Tax=Cyclocybe aegerita TaxID=1973307 RepID=A0A8S0WEP8_CYCAE|nr:unnamed protein product [Cyclocybe aegerita]